MVSCQMKTIKSEVRVPLGKAEDRAIQRQRGTNALVSSWMRVWEEWIYKYSL